MSKRLITTVLAAALALTSFVSAPVQAADRGEIARFAIGAGALILLGTALSNNNNRNRGDVHVTRRNTHPPRHREPTRHIQPRRNVVPSVCLQVNRSNHGPKRFVGSRCVNNNMRHAGRLPNQCLRSIHTNRGHRTVYGASCLRRNGWVFG